MDVRHYPEFAKLVKDFTHWLQREGGSHIVRRENDARLSDISFSFKPPVKKATVTHVAKPQSCTWCERRISYKAGQFANEPPELPYLILVHNAFKSSNRTPFHNPDVNDLFQRMLTTVVGFDASQFLIREVLRCHFGAEEVNDPKWFENCQNHIRTDIQYFNLKGILLIGQAAPFVIRDRKKLQQLSGEPTELFSLPAIISPGPTRLHYMQKKAYDTATIKSEKKRIYDALLAFRRNVMNLS